MGFKRLTKNNDKTSLQFSYKFFLPFLMSTKSLKSDCFPEAAIQVWPVITGQPPSHHMSPHHPSIFPTKQMKLEPSAHSHTLSTTSPIKYLTRLFRTSVIATLGTPLKIMLQII